MDQKSRSERMVQRLRDFRGSIPDVEASAVVSADGLIVEVHQNPEAALSDGAQSLKPERFAQMVKQVRAIARDVGRC